MSKRVKHIYKFGPFQLDLEQQKLWKDEEPVSLPPKVFETLVVLLERHGMVISKKEMIDLLWPDRYVEEANLSQNIFVLRSKLESDGDTKYIETVSKRGYRFIAPVNEIVKEVGPIIPAPPEEGASEIKEDTKKALGRHHTENPEAYRAYLKGRYHRNQHTVEGYAEAIKSFEQALSLDPDYAMAYSALADSYVTFDFYGVLVPLETGPKAKAAAINALRLDDTLAEAHLALACVQMMYERAWSEAEREFLRAIELDPHYAHARNWYSHFLMAMGRIEESLTQSELALKLDPLDESINQYLGWHYIHARQFDRAITQLEKTLADNPDFYLARVTLGRAYVQRREFRKAVSELDKAIQANRLPVVLGFLGHAYGMAGQRGEAERILEELQELSEQTYVPPYSIALVNTSLGRKDEAFEWLDKAFAAANEWLNWLKLDPALDSLRSDERFKQLLIKLKLQPDD